MQSSSIRLLGVAVLAAAVGGLGVSGGCSTAPDTKEKKEALTSEAQSSLKAAKAHDPTLETFLNKAYGYAVFPTVGKGAVGVGGAYGKGEVYEQGRMIGFCDLSQATIGLQLGGQSYTEIIAFETKETLDNFKGGKLKFSAQASAVALKSGAGANAKYSEGVAVFTMGEAGLMFEASIGGQSFSYQPK